MSLNGKVRKVVKLEGPRRTAHGGGRVAFALELHGVYPPLGLAAVEVSFLPMRIL